MRNKALPALLLTAALMLSACTARPVETAPEPTPPAVTEAPSPAPTPSAAPTPTPAPTPEPTPPAHTEFYLPDVTAEQVLEYFNEVVLDMEYSDGTGDVTLVQKWTEPIRYRIYGSATDADLEVLSALFAQLNVISGFPGIEAAEDGDFENLRLNFLSREELLESFREVINGEEAYGAVQFWYYTESNELYDARIGYRTDLDQTTRNSVLLEEIINALGVTDTVLRPDSIVYQYSNATTALSEIDWLILKLLYHPEIRCGMDAEACAAVIETLYH